MDSNPTEITSADIDNFVQQLMKSEIKGKTCFTCQKVYYLDGFGSMFMECDECFFKRIPKEEKEAFFRSFFE